MGFLCRQKALSVEHLDMIWAAGGIGQDKDRRICVHEVGAVERTGTNSLFCTLFGFGFSFGQLTGLFHQKSRPPVSTLPNRPGAKAAPV